MIDKSRVSRLVIRQVVKCSAKFDSSVGIVSRRLVQEQVTAIEFKLVMAVIVNFTAKVIGGKILVMVESQAEAVHKVPIQKPIAAKTMHCLDQVALVYHTVRSSSLKIPCSWSLHKTVQRLFRPIALFT